MSDSAPTPGMDRASSQPIPAVRIGIMGTPATSGNRGVQALGAATARLCLESRPDSSVALFGSHPDGRSVRLRPLGHPLDVPMVHWRLAPRAFGRHHLGVIVAAALLYRIIPAPRWRAFLARRIPWIGELEQTHIVGDIRGGDSFSDIYGLKRFLIATLPVLTVLWVKRGIVLFPQTYGPYRSWIARCVARFLIRRSSRVIARDTDSQAVARQLARADQTVHLSPDVAFALHVDDMPEACFDGSTRAELIPADCIGININGLMYNGGYTGKNMFGLQLDYRAFLPALIDRLLAEHPGTVLLVPHTYAPAGDVESDNEACRLVKAALPAHLQSRVRIVTGDYDCHQLKGIIGRCRFFIGSRMHSCIAALSQGVPCVGVAYSMKFRGVFASVGLADWVVDGRAVDNATAIAETLDRYRTRDCAQPALAAASRDARVRLHAAFADLGKAGAAAPHDPAASPVSAA